MVLSQTVDVHINGKTMKKYRDLGYKFDKIGDLISVKYTDLSQYSQEIIEIKCDYCGKIFNRRFSDHFRLYKGDFEQSDCCYDCRYKKQEELSLKKYGVKNPFQREDVKLKTKETLIKKYGVEYISQSDKVQNTIRLNNLKRYGVTSTSQLESVKEKVVVTNRERFGCDYPMQTQEFQNRIIETSLKKYGVPRPTMNKDVQEKVAKTNIERYGYENPFASPEIRKRINETKYSNGTQTSSRQQKYFCDILNGKLNYPFKKYFIDIALPEEKIAVEYNGGGHDLSVKLGYITPSLFKRNEFYRKKQLYSEGWRIITLISLKNKILSEEDTIKIFNFALETFNNGRHWIEVFIDEDKIINSQNEFKITQITMND